MGVTHFDQVQANKFMGPGAFNTQGNIYYVNPRQGNDSNAGTSPVIDSTQLRSRNAGPLATVLAAYNKCTAGQNDIVVLQAAGNSAGDTSDRISATITWAKNNTHLIGWSSDPMVSHRSRISLLSTATAANVTSILNVTASGCLFKGIQFYHGMGTGTAATGPCILISGSRNVFENCHIAGMGDATMVGAGGSSLKLNGGSENVFRDCVIGLDTVSAANLSKGEIHFDANASRNWFEGCFIQRYISNAAYVHVTVEDSTGIDRWQMFKSCTFYSDSVNRTISQTEVMAIPAMTQGKIILQDTYCVGDNEGATVWDDNNRGVIFTTMQAPVDGAVCGFATIED
jgi:hypothetical protein